MTSTLKQLKRRALARPDVRTAYDSLAPEFALLDERLKARAKVQMRHRLSAAGRVRGAWCPRSELARITHCGRRKRGPAPAPC